MGSRATKAIHGMVRAVVNRHCWLLMDIQKREELEEWRACNKLDALVANGKGNVARTLKQQTSVCMGGLEWGVFIGSL